MKEDKKLKTIKPRKEIQAKVQVKDKADGIQRVYQRYLLELSKLTKKQNDAVEHFLRQIEQKKIEDLRKELKNL